MDRRWLAGLTRVSFDTPRLGLAYRVITWIVGFELERRLSIDRSDKPEPESMSFSVSDNGGRVSFTDY